MAQKEYRAFHASLKQWIIDNQEDYDEFENFMTNTPEQGYFSIFQRSITYLPVLKKKAGKKLNSPDSVELSDVIAVAKESGLAQKLLATFENNRNIQFMPAMICWLYYGRSFENMVEFGEKIIENPQTSKLEKLKTLMMLKLLIWHSKKLKMRTDESWADYYNLRKVIGDTKSLDWAMDKKVAKGRKPSKKRDLIDLLNDELTDEDKSRLVKLMHTYLHRYHDSLSQHAATMYKALSNLKYWDKPPHNIVYIAIKNEIRSDIGVNSNLNHYLNDSNNLYPIKEDELAAAKDFFDLSKNKEN